MSNLVERLQAEIQKADDTIDCLRPIHDTDISLSWHELVKENDVFKQLLRETIVALSVAPAPVAAEPIPDMRLNENEQVAEDFAAAATEEFERIFGSGPLKMDLRKCPFFSEIHEGHKVYQGQYLSRDTRLMHSAYQAGATSPVLARLAGAPPVQEGPKGVEAEAKFEELLKVFASVIYTQGFHQTHSRYEAFDYAKWAPAETEALRQHFKQCTAQSIPAAIDEEVRGALEMAVACLRGEGLADDAVIVERLLSGNSP